MDPKEKRTLLIFYLLAVYIFCQIIWWGYSLLDVHLKLMKAEGMGDSLAYNRRIYMVMGEGTVFLIIFILGIWKIQRNLRRDFLLARTEKTFLLSVTHELKTPVSILRLMLETLKRKDLDPAKQKEIVAGALNETDRLQNLTENILFATRLNQDASSMYTEELDISLLASAVVDRFKNQFPDRIITEMDELLFIHGDQQSIQMLVSNLVDNALKYSPPEGKVKVILKRLGAELKLSVVDQGLGIPESERKKVFEKFYRIGNEETRKHRGTGLGLYIVAKIAELHHARLRIENNIPTGTIVEVIWMVPSK